MSQLNWAVLGTGVIANEMAQALQNMNRTLYGVCNRTHEKAVAFAEKYGIQKIYESYEEMFPGWECGHHLYHDAAQYAL